MIKIQIRNKQFNVYVVSTEEDMENGLKGVDELQKDEGMLFVFNDIGEHSMWMEDTIIPLDIIFINEDFEVTKVAKGEPLNKESLSSPDTKYVLELNAKSGVKVGDDVEFNEKDLEDDIPDKEDKDKMYVLDEKGNIQMSLYGNERIFSRNSTKVLVKKAKKAYKSKSDSDYLSLGKYLFKEINKHNTQDEEYVEIKE